MILRAVRRSNAPETLGRPLELEPGHQLARARNRSRAAHQVDKSVAAGDVAELVLLDRGPRCRSRIRPGPAVEHVRELGAHGELAFFFHAENAAQADVFSRAAGAAEVGIASRGGPPVAGPRIHPGVRIQGQRLAGIEALAIDVLRPNRLSL